MSVNIDPSEWRLETDSGIKYKLVEGYPHGTFDDEDADAEEKYIIQASDLWGFVNESFPKMVTTPEGGALLDAKRKFPSLSSLKTTRISWESFDSGKPVDPWGVDAGAPDGTYCPFLHLMISYGTGKNASDPDDPETYLEISGSSTGELIQAAPSGQASFDSLSGDPVENPMLPLTKKIPTFEWNVRWTQIPKSFFPIMVQAMRPRIGLVNSAVIPMFQNAIADTVLFNGYSFQDQYTWKTDWADQPPVTIDMKFEEKHVKFDLGAVQGIAGHNHAWRPDEGTWARLFIDGKPPYEQTDLNGLFPPNIVVPVEDE